MIKKIFNKIIALSKRDDPIDPKQFQDSLAEQTQWTPTAKISVNIQSHRLIQSEPMRMEFRTTVTTYILDCFFCVAGTAIIGFTVFINLQNSDPVLTNDAIFGSLLGLFFLISGASALKIHSNPAVFDKQIGYFWKGNKQVDMYQYRPGVRSKYSVALSDIHALQLISKFVPGSQDASSYCVFELNLVLADAQRINVIAHGYLKIVREDADKLARFLGIPIWDAIQEYD